MKVNFSNVTTEKETAFSELVLHLLKGYFSGVRWKITTKGDTVEINSENPPKNAENGG